MTLDNPEMERMIQAVAERAAAAVASRVPSTSEIEKIAFAASEQAITAFSKRLGIPEDNLDDWHSDRMWLRSRRQLESAVIRQGILAVVLALLGALGTAVVFWLKSGAPR